MKKILIAAGAVLIASTAWALRFRNTHDVLPSDLTSRLKAAGYDVLAVSCGPAPDGYCEVVIKGETPGTDISPQVNASKTLAQEYADIKANQDSMHALARKWRGGTITPAERDELLKLFVLGSLGE